VELYWTTPPSYQAIRSDMEVGSALRDLGYL